MTSEQHDWPLELSTAIPDASHGAGGSIAAGLAWVDNVLDGRLADAWPATSSLFRLALARHWCWRNRAALHAAGYDPPLLAAALADEGPAHPIWPAFARSQRPPDAGERSPGDPPRWVAAGPPEPVGPDLEVVQLVRSEMAGTAHHAPPLTLLLRLSPDGWLVAGHGRTPVQPGWPPCR
jgi:hypothetical protein